MRLKNYTDIDDEFIRSVIRAVRPAGISNFDVRVSNSQYAMRGRAYWAGKDNRREVLAALDYAEVIGKLRGWDKAQMKAAV